MKYFVLLMCLQFPVISALRSAAPNVLFIVADDMRPAIGCYGDEEVFTPNLDQLCTQSVRFQNAFAQQALCGPSRTSFLTSRRPETLHLCDVHSYWRTAVGNFTSLPQHFKDHGYYTASVGKVFHPGKASNFSDDYPLSWSEVPYHASTEKYKMKKVCPGMDGELHMNLVCPVDITTQPEGTLPDIQATQHAIKLLKMMATNKSQPFFLGVGYHKPHIPLKYPREYLDLFPISSVGLADNPHRPKKMPDIAWNPWADLRQREDIQLLNASFPFGPLPDYFQRIIRQNYYAAIAYMDDLVGQLLQTLTDTGVGNNTIIVFLGDHGWSLGEHQEWSKYSNFEVSTRAPLLLHVPGLTNTSNWIGFRRIPVLQYGSKKLKTPCEIRCSANLQNNANVDCLVSENLVEFVDLFPTLAELAKLPIPPVCPADSAESVFCTEGSSLVPLIKALVTDKTLHQHAKWKPAVFSQYPRPSIYPIEESDQPKRADIKYMGYTMRTQEYRYTEWISFDQQKFQGNWSSVIARELYIKGQDQEENHNVADKAIYADLVNSLSHQLKLGWRHALPPVGRNKK